MKTVSYPLWYALCVVLGTTAALLGRYLGESGSALFALTPLVVSIIAMAAIRALAEPNTMDVSIMDPRTQSWAFLYGDGIFLPLAFLGGSLSWRVLSQRTDAYYQSSWWALLAVFVASVSAFVFRYAFNAPSYEKAGLSSLLDSPTSIWHDFVVYAVLVYLFVIVCVPAFISDFSGWGWLVLVGFVGWAVMVQCDLTIHELNPANLHPPAEETILRR